MALFSMPHFSRLSFTGAISALGLLAAAQAHAADAPAAQPEDTSNAPVAVQTIDQILLDSSTITNSDLRKTNHLVAPYGHVSAPEDSFLSRSQSGTLPTMPSDPNTASPIMGSSVAPNPTLTNIDAGNHFFRGLSNIFHATHVEKTYQATVALPGDQSESLDASFRNDNYVFIPLQNNGDQAAIALGFANYDTTADTWHLEYNNLVGPGSRTYFTLSNAHGNARMDIVSIAVSNTLTDTSALYGYGIATIGGLNNNTHKMHVRGHHKLPPVNIPFVGTSMVFIAPDAAHLPLMQSAYESVVWNKSFTQTSYETIARATGMGQDSSNIDNVHLVTANAPISAEINQPKIQLARMDTRIRGKLITPQFATFNIQPDTSTDGAQVAAPANLDRSIRIAQADTSAAPAPTITVTKLGPPTDIRPAAYVQDATATAAAHVQLATTASAQPAKPVTAAASAKADTRAYASIDDVLTEVDAQQTPNSPSIVNGNTVLMAQTNGTDIGAHNTAKPTSEQLASMTIVERQASGVVPQPRHNIFQALFRHHSSQPSDLSLAQRQANGEVRKPSLLQIMFGKHSELRRLASNFGHMFSPRHAPGYHPLDLPAASTTVAATQQPSALAATVKVTSPRSPIEMAPLPDLPKVATVNDNNPTTQHAFIAAWRAAAAAATTPDNRKDAQQKIRAAKALLPGALHEDAAGTFELVTANLDTVLNNAYSANYRGVVRRQILSAFAESAAHATTPSVTEKILQYVVDHTRDGSTLRRHAEQTLASLKSAPALTPKAA